MFLRHIQKHMRGLGLLVNGTTYKVGPDGLLLDARGQPADIPLADAKRLLDPPRTDLRVVEKKELAKGKGSAKGKKALPPAPPDPSVETEDDPADDPEGEPEGEPEDGEPETEDETTPEAAPAGDPPIPAEGEAWPDPTEDMSKAYLQAMADAYEVPYTARTSAKKLVELCKKAMYED